MSKANFLETRDFQSVVDRLLDEESSHLADLEEFIGKTISFRVEPTYSQEHFDIVLL